MAIAGIDIFLSKISIHMRADQFIWPTAITFGEIVYPSGGSLRPRQHRHLQIVLVYRGSMTVWIDNQRHDAEAGTASLLLPGHKERFAFAAHAETYHSWTHLATPELPWSLAPFRHDDRPDAAPLRHPPRQPADRAGALHCQRHGNALAVHRRRRTASHGARSSSPATNA